MKIAIVGYGKQGRSVYEYFRDGDHEITILDKNQVDDLPEGATFKSGDDYLTGLDQYDLIFRTPTIHPREIVSANSEAILSKVTSNTNQFFEDCPTKNIIGVTGTKGKGTTCTLISEMLKALGYKVHLGGNIGTPPLDLLMEGIESDDWVVLELANYQLIDLKYSPHIALCLLVEPEHLDWHSNLDEYYGSKKQLFKQQTAEDIAIYYSLNNVSQEIASSGAGKLIPYFSAPGALVVDDSIVIDSKPVVKTDEIQLLGTHSYQNVCAALTVVWQINQDITKMSQAIKDFKPLPFRLELRKEVDGVKFYNDSFSSAPTSAVAAIEAVPGMKVFILGGKDRGIDLSELSKTVTLNEALISHVLLIGESAQRLSQSLDDAGFNNYEIYDASDMDSIVKRAKEFSTEGSSVVLSPGFPSFDMFTNFEDRGNKFNAAVESL